MPRKNRRLARTPKVEQDDAYHERKELNNMPAQMRKMLSDISRLQLLVTKPGPVTVHESTALMTKDLNDAIREANKMLRSAVEKQTQRRLELFAKLVGSERERYWKCDPFVLQTSELSQLLAMRPPEDATSWAKYMESSLNYLATRMASVHKTRPSPEDAISLLGERPCKENDFDISVSLCDKLTIMLAQFRPLPKGGTMRAFQIMMLIVSRDWPRRVAECFEQLGSTHVIGGAVAWVVWEILLRQDLRVFSQHHDPDETCQLLEDEWQVKGRGGWLEDPKLAYWDYAQAYRQLWTAFVRYPCEDQDCDHDFYSSGCRGRAMPCSRKRSLGFISLLQERAIAEVTAKARWMAREWLPIGSARKLPAELVEEVVQWSLLAEGTLGIQPIWGVRGPVSPPPNHIPHRWCFGVRPASMQRPCTWRLSEVYACATYQAHH